ADAGDSKSPGLTPLGVRFPSSALRPKAVSTKDFRVAGGRVDQPPAAPAVRRLSVFCPRIFPCTPTVGGQERRRSGTTVDAAVARGGARGGRSPAAGGPPSSALS